MRRPPRAATLVTALVGATLASVLLAAPPAAAQTPAPGSTTSPAAPAPQPQLDEPAPPPVSPSLESADTAAPDAPVQPLLPPATTTGTAVPGALPPSIVQESLGSVPPREQRRRVYETRWFWGAIGVLVVTAAVVLVFAVNSANPTTPSTKLGDMRAF